MLLFYFIFLVIVSYDLDLADGTSFLFFGLGMAGVLQGMWKILVTICM